MKIHKTKCKGLPFLLALSVLLCGCGREIGKPEETTAARDPDTSVAEEETGEVGKWMEEIEVGFGAFPSTVQSYRDAAQNFDLYMGYAPCFVGVVEVVSYQFYIDYYYDTGRECWFHDGHADYVLKITDISGKWNNSEKKVGDTVVCREYLTLQFKGDDLVRIEELKSQIGWPGDALTEEERLHDQFPENSYQCLRQYAVPERMINAEEFQIYQDNQAGLLRPGVSYDVFVVMPEEADGVTQLRNNSVMYAYPTSIRYGEERIRDYTEGLNQLFREYIAANEAEIGLKRAAGA